MMATPVRGQEEVLVEIVPRLTAAPADARRWIRGEAPLRARDADSFFDEVSRDEQAFRRNHAYLAVDLLRNMLGHLLSGDASESGETLLKDIGDQAEEALRQVRLLAGRD
jgi:hypothetical protein